jgi:hypothetical protein
MALFLNSTPFTSTPLAEERPVDGVALTIPGSELPERVNNFETEQAVMRAVDRRVKRH